MYRKTISLLLLLLIVWAFSLAESAMAQTSAFTYQAHLSDTNDASLSGPFDFIFALYNDATSGALAGSVQTNTAVIVTNGNMTSTLDFGKAFDGNRYWLEIGLRTNGATDDFVILSPRQEITAAPYALFSANVNSSGILGTLSDAQLSTNVARLDTNLIFTGAVQFSNPSNSFTGQFAGDAGALSNLNAANLQGTLTTTNPTVRGAIAYAPDIASVTDYVTNSDTAAPVTGLIRRCLYAPYDASHVTNWCLVLRSAIHLAGNTPRRWNQPERSLICPRSMSSASMGIHSCSICVAVALMPALK